MSELSGKRRQIIEGAVAEFQEHGFSGVSMDRVAARANVSKRTVYNHFDSKEALFRAILDIMLEACSEAFTVSYIPGEPIQDQLVKLGWAEGQLLTSRDFMKLARMVVGETMRDPDLAAEMNRKMDHMSMFNRFMEAAIADTALDAENAELVATQFVGLIKAQAFWPMVFSDDIISREEMDVLIDDSVDMILSRYGK
ncbi:TetR/AcrR family transcriptional regulator [Coralliovum pocilloporae]|uniref:TetR/AcrR family transcriptional regulator n=1 Tax=Coralliovum pocilloporae TaxID=3066369 RepID=UPI00330745EE